jgi:hypothetical protein
MAQDARTVVMYVLAALALAAMLALARFVASGLMAQAGPSPSSL